MREYHGNVGICFILWCVDMQIRLALTRYPFVTGDEGAYPAKLALHGILRGRCRGIARIRIIMEIVDVGNMKIVGGASGVCVDKTAGIELLYHANYFGCIKYLMKR